MWVPYTGHPHQSVCCMRPPCSSDLHAVVSEKFKPSGISGFCIHRRAVGPLRSLCCPLLLAVNRISDKIKLLSIQEISGHHHVPWCMTKMQVLTANCDSYSVSKCRQQTESCNYYATSEADEIISAGNRMEKCNTYVIFIFSPSPLLIQIFKDGELFLLCFIIFLYIYIYIYIYIYMYSCHI